MSKSTPSLLALLGLVAVAGYQHRGKISEMLSNAKQSAPGASADSDRDGGGFLSEIGRMFQAGSGGTALSGGLSELVGRFRESGQGASAESWVSNGSNLPVQDRDLATVLGDDTLSELSRKTGLTREELIQRLGVGLPETVNRLTPHGHLPTPAEAEALA